MPKNSTIHGAEAAINRMSVSTSTHWETIAGYARAVRVGNLIWVSGTTATDSNGQLVGGDDPAEQLRFIIRKIEAAIIQLGGNLKQVVRTRIYVSDIALWEPVARVHGEFFGDIRPANTLVEARLVGDEYLVEMEADAFIVVKE